MTPALLPALLGLTLLLPGTQALTCQSGYLQAVMNVTARPLEWTLGKQICEEGWGCEDTLMILENGPEVFLAVTKGCTQEEDQEARVTQHREGPGLSIVSYTRVCRHKDLCNDLSTAPDVLTPTPPAVLGSVRCPVCFFDESCKPAREMTCPFGHTHCYNGVLKLWSEAATYNMRVQGCMSQAACNLLNDTQKIGSLSLRESCEDIAPPTCQDGLMFHMKPNLTKEPVQWDAFHKRICGLQEVCQETLLLVDVGPRSLLWGIKGCGKSEAKNFQNVSILSKTPGVLIASYVHSCSSNGCNNASSSSILLNSLPHPDAPAPGDLQCPACVEMDRSCTDAVNVTCPKGTTGCYNHSIVIKRGELSSVLHIQGCMAQPSNSLLKHIDMIETFHSGYHFDGQSVDTDLQTTTAPIPLIGLEGGPATTPSVLDDLPPDSSSS